MNSELQLARTEGLRLLRHPAVWLALAAMVPWVASDWDGTGDQRYVVLIGYVLVLPGFTMMTVTILAVLRGRASRTDVLLETLPVGPDRRSLAHGLSTIAAAGLGLLATAAVLVVVRPGRTLGAIAFDTVPVGVETPRPNLAQLLQGSLAMVVVCAVAVALVRWVPSWLVAVPLLFVAAVQFTFEGNWFAHRTGVINWSFPLATGVVTGGWTGDCNPGCELLVGGFDSVTPWWHLGYLLAVALLAVVVAVLRHRRDRPVWISLAITGALVIALVGIQAAVYERYDGVVVR